MDSMHHLHIKKYAIKGFFFCVFSFFTQKHNLIFLHFEHCKHFNPFSPSLLVFFFLLTIAKCRSVLILSLCKEYFSYHCIMSIKKDKDPVFDGENVQLGMTTQEKRELGT